MPDVARQRVPADAEHAYPGEGRAHSITTGADCSGRPAPSRRSRPVDSLSRLIDLMRSVSVRRLVGALGATLALATALLIPVGYGLIEYWKDSEALAYKADLSAARAATFILGGQADWRGDTERLRAAIDVGGRNAAPVRQSVTDARGATVLETGDAPPAPTYSRIAPITVHGIIAGWSRIVDSLRPLLIKVAIVAGVSLTLAVAAYYMFATLPLKLLDRSLSELERANARFRQQNLLLDTALGNMFQGLAMFDAGERLVIANGRFAEMYGLPPEDIRPGTPLRRILAHRVASAAEGNATVEDQLQALRKQLACSNSSHLAERLSDGRAILVSIRPMPEGGWVSTHQDVTERENLNAELAHQNELLRQREDELEERNKQFDAALRNMSQGLAMFDAEQRLVICNELYARIYGLTPDQVEPGTPLHRIVRQQIANGCQSEGDADALQGWLARRAAGEGPSQMTCELEDGRAVSVSAQTMPNGGIVTTHRDITEQRYAEARIVHMALHDSLTELPNRTLLDERLQQALTRVRRGEMVAVHTLDLDHFKTVNDTLGHPIGDKLLKQVTERLLALVRETDTVARMGGDEFAIVQVAIGQPTDATTLAHRIIEVVSKPYDIEGQQIDIGASIGIAMAPADGDNPADLLRNSDLALYRAKGDGRGTFCFFEPCMDEQMQARRVLESDLRRAIPAREFELHYQPVIDLDSNEISSFEALVRWRHPLKGLVPPDVFLPLAEKLGITIALGEWAIRDACTTARGWSRELNVAVNLSPRQFRNPGLVQIVADALDDSGLPAHRLELDITEPVLMGESESALSVLHGLRDLGVKLAMDDFGTGYASLSYLHSFAFDKIKIDRSFVKSVAADSGSLNVVRAVAAMAHSLGMSTTAEGVETFEQLEIVRTEGCNEIQGFLFSPPLPASDIDRILKRGIRFAMPAGAENAA